MEEVRVGLVECSEAELKVLSNVLGRSIKDIVVPWNPERTKFIRKLSVRCLGKDGIGYEFYHYLGEPFEK